MNQSRLLAQKLNDKIERLVDRYQLLKSENEMLRDELKATKLTLENTQKNIETLENSGGLDSEEMNLLLDKLEDALGND